VSGVHAEPGAALQATWLRALLPLCGEFCERSLWVPEVPPGAMAVGPGAMAAGESRAAYSDTWPWRGRFRLLPALGYSRDDVEQLFYREVLGGASVPPHSAFRQRAVRLQGRLLGLEMRTDLASGNALYTRLEQYSESGAGLAEEVHFRATVLQIRYAF